MLEDDRQIMDILEKLHFYVMHKASLFLTNIWQLWFYSPVFSAFVFTLNKLQIVISPHQATLDPSKKNLWQLMDFNVALKL